MCLHETIQLSRDGSRTILCGDCDREFAKLASDDAETLVVPVVEGTSIVLLDGDLEKATGGLAVENTGGWFRREPIYPCARCGFAMSCDEDEGGCHT